MRFSELTKKSGLSLSPTHLYIEKDAYSEIDATTTITFASFYAGW
jgi:hypothetical protein